MSKRKTVRAAASDGSTPPQAPPPKKKTLTWRQERFVEEYVWLKGNGTRAAAAAGYPHPKEEAYRQLTKVHILEAIEARKEEVQAITGVSKEKILEGLAAMAFATLDDFEQVWEEPAKKKSYKGLGSKRLALASAKKTITVTSSRDGTETEKFENEIKIITPGERRAAFNDLWDKLGLGKGEGGRDRKSFLERFALLSAKLGRGGDGGGQTGG